MIQLVEPKDVESCGNKVKLREIKWKKKQD